MQIKPKCPHCGHLMEFRHSEVHGGGIAREVSKGCPIRDDQIWKCLNCFHTAHFGIPLTKKQASEELALRGGSPFLLRPSERQDEVGRKEVMKRLKELGYIDF